LINRRHLTLVQIYWKGATIGRSHIGRNDNGMTDAEPDLPGFGGEEGGPDSQTMHFMTTSLLKHDQGSKMPFHYVHPIRVLFYTPFRVLVYLPFVC
jgi:hypothetical protein